MTKSLIGTMLFCLAVGACAVAFLSLIALRNGTHALYCPATSAIWIFPCTPTARAIGMASWIAFMISLPVFLLAVLLTGVGRKKKHPPISDAEGSGRVSHRLTE